MIIILMGAPGVGKGTQSVALSKWLKIPHIALGDILRKNVLEQTKIGKEAEDFMKNGLLVPDEVIIEVVNSRIQEDDCEKGFILDGFPRTITQAEDLEKLLGSEGKKATAVFNIEAEYKHLLERIIGRRVCKNCGATYHVLHHKSQNGRHCDVCGEELVQRKDDTEETLNNRIKEYEEQTKPLIGFYEERGLLITINAEDIKENITERILKHLGESV
ncbi:MAG TPA: adenylate kinase [Clostridiales bacterium]|nr:MAG: adenylate kinase [Clostridiales bacterium GWD2_32_59]HAN09239.1 adenylate kinase [Clostridiales bacterium]